MGVLDWLCGGDDSFCGLSMWLSVDGRNLLLGPSWVTTEKEMEGLKAVLGRLDSL